MFIDERSLRILSALAEHKTDNLDRIAEVADIPTSTVHYRIRRLTEDGVIENDLLDVDLETVGLNAERSRSGRVGAAWTLAAVGGDGGVEGA